MHIPIYSSILLTWISCFSVYLLNGWCTFWALYQWQHSVLLLPICIWPCLPTNYPLFGPGEGCWPCDLALLLHSAGPPFELGFHNMPISDNLFSLTMIGQRALNRLLEGKPHINSRNERVSTVYPNIVTMMMTIIITTIIPKSPPLYCYNHDLPPKPKFNCTVCRASYRELNMTSPQAVFPLESKKRT